MPAVTEQGISRRALASPIAARIAEGDNSVAPTYGGAVDRKRQAGADAALKEAGVMSEEQAGPFAALAKLRNSDES